VNGLSDPAIIDALYAASERGRRDRPDRARHLLPAPGVEGLSERIRVRSVLGRYLEHSRIFRFGAPERRRESGSAPADLMQRNLDCASRRSCQVEDPALVARIDAHRSRSISIPSRAPSGSRPTARGSAAGRVDVQERLRALTPAPAARPLL
jgi:polyphosphate kinase